MTIIGGKLITVISLQRGRLTFAHSSTFSFKIAFSGKIPEIISHELSELCSS
jgi:hypothetical protein